MARKPRAGGPIDRQVGKQIRRRRWELGLTQQQLAAMVGVKFQQIQKYETGANRVSAGRLWELAGALNIRITYFFEGLDEKEGELPRAQRGSVAVQRQAAEIGELFIGLPSKKRTALLELVRAMAAGE